MNKTRAITEPKRLTVARAEQTRQRPAGDRFVVGACCTLCGGAEMVISSTAEWSTPLTFSRLPNAEGLHTQQAHQAWCPLVNDRAGGVSCSHCGAQVDGYTYEVGFTAEVDMLRSDGTFGPVHFAGTSSKILDGGVGQAIQTALQAPRMAPAPEFDEATLEPCGHVMLGSDAHTIRAALAQLGAARREQRAREVLDEQEAMLAAARLNGGAAVVALYRRAVREESADARGLLAAVEALAR